MGCRQLVGLFVLVWAVAGVSGLDVFVNASSTWTITSCGNVSAPCGTIADGVQAACDRRQTLETLNSTVVHVEEGEYVVTSSILILCPLSIL